MNTETFRQVMGQYPTGVVVVTALGAAGEALGMTVGSFTSVSLDPPLVAFLPSKTSRSWQALRESGGRYCVNILSVHQEPVCRAIASGLPDRFAGIGWQLSPGGSPLIDGAVAYVDCTVQAIHDAGDHLFVLCRADGLGVQNSAYPLLFFRGGYGSFTHGSLAAADAGLFEHLSYIDQARPHMEQLAARFGTEVTAVVLAHGELIRVAAAGRPAGQAAPTRIGQRFPLTPPSGAIYAAWKDPAAAGHWPAAGGHWPAAAGPAPKPEELRKALTQIRNRGYSLALGGDAYEHVETLATRLRDGDPAVTPAHLHRALLQAAHCYNPELPDHQDIIDFRWAAAPVFGPRGQIAFTITLWCPHPAISRTQLDDYTSHLTATAATITTTIGGTQPE